MAEENEGRTDGRFKLIYHNMEIGYRRYDVDRKSTVSTQLARDPSASITKQFQRHVQQV